MNVERSIVNIDQLLAVGNTAYSLAGALSTLGSDFTITNSNVSGVRQADRHVGVCDGMSFQQAQHPATASK
jgi:hypothetical protein